MSGDEVRSLITALLDEIDFLDVRNLGARDPHKLVMLQEELMKSIKQRPNFAAIMCQAVEGGARAIYIQQDQKFPDDFIGLICRTLKLSPGQTLAVAFALAQSKNASIAKESVRLIRQKLAEIATNILIEVHEMTVQGLAYFISHHEELANVEVSGKFFALLRQPIAPGDLDHGGHLRAPTQQQQQQQQQQPQGMPSIALILVEKGCGVSASTDLFRKVLKETGVPLVEEQVASLIVTLVTRVISGGGKDGDDKIAEANRWNLEVVAEVLSQECRGLNWTAVARYLDQPNLVIRSEVVFQILTRMFVRVAGVPVPAAGLIANWTNKHAQLAMLVLAANAHRNIVDFTSMVTAEQTLPQQDVPMPPNLAWLCLPLYSALLQLASAGLALEVLEAIALAANTYPEYVTVCLAQVQDPNSGVRAEVLRRTLPLFTGLQGSRPTSLIVMKKLMAVNPELLVLLFRIALKRANSVMDILEIDNRLKAFGVAVMARLEEEAGIEEILGYLCVKADSGEVNLDQRVAIILESNPQHARTLANFLKAHVDALRPRNSDGGLLSFECFTIVLRAIQVYTAIVPIEELRALAGVLAQHQQQQQQLAAAGQQQQQQQQPNGSNGMEPGNSGGDPNRSIAGGPASEDIEEEANAYFQKIYTSDISIPDVIVLLKRFKASTEKREQEIFRCMIHNLFDEYRFFQKYPDKELLVTGKLFGSLIQHQLVSSITLGIALRYVLEALRKDPEQGNEKMFRFGRIALDQFRSRLSEWPQYCSHLIQIPHLSRHCTELMQEAQRALGNGPDGGSGPYMPEHVSSVQQQLGDLSLSGGPKPPTLSDGGATSAAATAALHTQSPPILPSNAASAPDEDLHAMERSSRVAVIERMAVINVELPNTVVPPETVRDKILMIFNNIDKMNMDAKVGELKTLLNPDYYNWLANYLVVKRISAQPNLHPLYLSVLDQLDSNQLNRALLESAYHNATKLLLNPTITSSSSDRSLLRNLGIWLGLTTLARNKPILQRRISLKDLLVWGYETGRVIAVCSFVAKIVEGCKESKVFRPPNPWLLAILGVMRELYEVEDLKMNIKFEVQVLCRALSVKMEDIPKTAVLVRGRQPLKDVRNPDFNIKPGASSSSASQLGNTAQSGVSMMSGHSPVVTAAVASGGLAAMQQLPTSAASAAEHEAAVKLAAATASASAAAAANLQEQTVIPNLASFVTINPSLQYFTSNPAQRRLVPLAVDRAIRELIQPVVERSVTIASVSTKQLILKDFATDANEQLLRQHAHLMNSNLAGGLALVTCKEPLRLSICNHLRTLLATATVNDPALVEQIVQVCSNDNLDLGCMLIEKAAMEKAIRDIDEGLAAAYQQRRKSREAAAAAVAAGQPPQPYVDTSVPKGAKYPKELPDGLKARLGGLSPQQLQLYEGYQRQRQPPASSSTSTSGGQQQQGSPVFDPATGASTGEGSNANAALTMSQALEGYQQLFNRIEMALRSVQMQLQGREISLVMLGPDNEILNFLREIIAVTHRTQPAVRNETAMTFAENIFKRLLESIGAIENLRAEVMVGILEALKDVSGGPKKLSVEMVAWLNNYSTFSVNEESSRKTLRSILILLLRAKLLRSQDIDAYFSTYMDAGRNMVWVELALAFVKQCLSESLAATYEFANIFDTVSKIRPANTNVRKQLQKILTDLRALATSKEEEKLAAANAVATGGQPQSQQQPVAATAGQPIAPNATAAPNGVRDAAVREHVAVLLEKWIRVWTTVTDQIFGQYLQLMHQAGVLKTEEAADRFFRISAELCAEACVKSGQYNPSAQTPEAAIPATLSYNVIDGLSKLFILLMRLADKESSDISVRVNLLGRILNAIARALIEDHETKKANKLPFDQRPYFRLLSNLALDLGIPDPKKEANPALLPILAIYSQVYAALQPAVVPGFSLGWLQLVSQRSFLPHLMLAKNQKGWPYILKLLTLLLSFLQPSLKGAQLDDAVRKLYKGSLRVMLVLLHDFPEFLCEYHLILCDLIPSTCVQLRNLVLSAFPRSMRLPDPFIPNLKVEMLPEVAQPPRLLADYFNVLNDSGIRQRIDGYMTSKQPADLPSLIPQALLIPGAGVNLALTNSLVIYVGSLGAVQLQNKVGLSNSPAMDIYKALFAAFDNEARYHLLNCMANQLRYPNSHTHFFSYVLLVMFAESESNEAFQEQITRVLLERLIVHRPHPWGLLITFIELIKNPRYGFWRKGFTRCAPEIERVFESVARSCIGPTVTAVQQQQQQLGGPSAAAAVVGGGPANAAPTLAGAGEKR